MSEDNKAPISDEQIAEAADAARESLVATTESVDTQTEEVVDTPTPEVFEPTTAQVQAAKHVGLSNEEIAKLDQSSAERVLDQSKRVRRRETKNDLESKAAPETKEPAEKVSVDLLEDDTLEPQTLGRVNTMSQQMAEMEATIAEMQSTNQTLQATQDEFMSDAQQSAEQNQQQAINGFFDGLDKKAWKVFGTGNTDDLMPASPERLARDELITTAKTLKGTFPDSDQGTLLEMALMTLHKTIYDEAAARPVREAQEARDGSALAKPSGSVMPDSTEDYEKFCERKILAECARVGIPQ